MPRPSSAPKLLDAAELCLLEGQGDFEMRDVSARANVSEGLTYHHFRNKAGLVTAVVERFFDRYDAVLNAHKDRSVPWAVRERERLDELVDFLYAEPLARVVFGALSRLPESAAAEIVRRQALVAKAAHNVRSGQEQGAIPESVDAEVAGASIIGAVNAVVGYGFAGESLPDRARVKAELWRVVAAIAGLDG